MSRISDWRTNGRIPGYGCLLAGGNNIVIHCHGGLGRTGMIGARLLVEFGDQPDVAFR